MSKEEYKIEYDHIMKLYNSNDQEYKISLNTNISSFKKGYEILIHKDKTIQYLLNGALHREGGVQFIKINGYQEWCIHGKRHNLNGPAIINPNGTKEYWITNEYWINGKFYEENEFWIIQKKCFKCHQIFGNFYDLKVHLEQYDDSKNMIEYVFKLLLG